MLAVGATNVSEQFPCSPFFLFLFFFFFVRTPSASEEASQLVRRRRARPSWERGDFASWYLRFRVRNAGLIEFIVVCGRFPKLEAPFNINNAATFNYLTTTATSEKVISTWKSPGWEKVNWKDYSGTVGVTVRAKSGTSTGRDTYGSIINRAEWIDANGKLHVELLITVRT